MTSCCCAQLGTRRTITCSRLLLSVRYTCSWCDAYLGTAYQFSRTEGLLKSSKRISNPAKVQTKYHRTKVQKLQLHRMLRYSEMLKPFVTIGTYMSHLQRVFMSAGITVPQLFSMLPSTLKCLYTAEPVSMHFPAKQQFKNDNACNAACNIIFKRLFRRKMHSGWFNGIEILQGRWQHGE